MRLILRSLAVFVVAAALTGCTAGRSQRDTVYQVSTIDALLAGQYDGATSVAELRRHGDLGVGTFDELDGEMVVVDGVFYQVRVDGHAYQVSERITTPFAAVTWFEPDATLEVGPCASLQELEEALDTLVQRPNGVHAIRIEGEFEYVKARSVPAQKKPYRPLVEVVQDQRSFQFRSVRGVMVGFRCPESFRGANVPGYHLHFLNAMRTRGGHVLDCRVRRATVQVDYTDELHMTLPHTGAFGVGAEADLEKVER